MYVILFLVLSGVLSVSQLDCYSNGFVDGDSDYVCSKKGNPGTCRVYDISVDSPPGLLCKAQIRVGWTSCGYFWHDYVSYSTSRNGLVDSSNSGTLTRAGSSFYSKPFWDNNIRITVSYHRPDEHCGSCDNFGTYLSIVSHCVGPFQVNATKIVKSGVRYQYFNFSHPGYYYFTLPGYVYASVANLSWTVTMGDYTGKVSPRIFLANRYLPTLERFDYTTEINTTSNSRSITGSIFIDDVASNPFSNYVFGVLLYGSASYAEIYPRIVYQALSFPRETPLNYELISSQDIPLNITLSMSTPSIKLTFSKIIPGGNATILVGYGYLPTLQFYDYSASTSNQFYGEFVIKNSYLGPNQGNIMVLLHSESQKSGVSVQWS